jgi:predicted phosphodiesterase
VGTTGGTVSRLYFSVVGDTRPANVDDTSGYPTSVITKIFQDMQSMNPPPSFGVSTGDYMFATPGKGNAQPQLNLYEQAKAGFSNVMFPAMGNHECTGYTASNCGSGNTDGVTENYTAFLNTMLAPLGQSKPYYSINVNDTNGAWTAKFVFIAGNAWDSGQSSWLDSTLAQATTYTFIMRHEPASANTAPGVSPSEAIMAKHPYTLAIVGHTHEYTKSGAKEVIIGNGGAPLSSGNYGFGLVQQLASGVIQVDMIDYSTLQPDTKFEFRVNPDGSAAP